MFESSENITIKRKSVFESNGNMTIKKEN